MTSAPSDAAAELPEPASGPLAPKIVLALCVVAAGVVQSAYWNAGPYYDDHYHRAYVQPVIDGRRSLTDFVLLTHNEHFIPAWRLWYYALFRWSPDNPRPWHLTMTLAHVGTGLCVYFLLRHYLEPNREPPRTVPFYGVFAVKGDCTPLRRRFSDWLLASDWAAVFGAGLWMVSAIGGFDNPNLWIGASHLSFALFWIMAAMVCATHCRAARSRAWAVAMALAMTMAVATMSSVWLMTLVLPVQLWFAGRRSAEGGGRAWPARFWYVTWAISFAVLGAVTFYYLANASEEVRIRLPWMQLPGAAMRAFEGSTIALARLCAGDVSIPGEAPLILASLALFAVLGLAAFWLPVEGRILALVGVLVVPYLVLLHWARLPVERATVLDWGRYAYLPTLGWCLVIGAFAAAIARRVPRRVAAIGMVIATALVVVAGVQWRLAQSALVRFQAKQVETQESLGYYAPVVRALEAYGTGRGRPVRILDRLAAPPSAPYLSTVLPLLDIGPGLEIADAERYTAADFDDAQRALGEAGDSGELQRLARDWSAVLTTSWNLAELLKHLSDVGIQSGRPLAVPNVKLAYQRGLAISLEELTLMQFPGGLPGIRFVRRSQIEPAEIDAIQQALAGFDSPASQDFSLGLESLRR